MTAVLIKPKLITVLLISFFACLVIAGCKTKTDLQKIASYVGDREHGLTKKTKTPDDDITCQLVPPHSNTAQSGLRFLLYVNTGAQHIGDSILYQVNYGSAKMFHLVSGTDTLQPVLSERTATGRTDVHEFEV